MKSTYNWYRPQIPRALVPQYRKVVVALGYRNGKFVVQDSVLRPGIGRNVVGKLLVLLQRIHMSGGITDQ